jgi:hypothetical protein
MAPYVKGAVITHSRPKIHRFPVPKKASRLARAKQWLALRTDQDKAYFLSAISAVFVFSAVIIHISKLWGGAFIPEASAHAVVPPTTMQMVEKADKTIIINGKDGGIVGQVTHIQPAAAEVTGIKTMTEVDNRASRDLLSVVNKY